MASAPAEARRAAAGGGSTGTNRGPTLVSSVVVSTCVMMRPTRSAGGGGTTQSRSFRSSSSPSRMVASRGERAQSLPEERAGAREPRLHRPEIDLEGTRDLFVFEVVVFAQHDH